MKSAAQTPFKCSCGAEVTTSTCGICGSGPPTAAQDHEEATCPTCQARLADERAAAQTCPECGTDGEHGLGCPAGPYPVAGETMGSVSPCFVNCGEPACLKLGCIRVYNDRHRNDREVRAWNG
jgi:hypothetical protein